jgi:tetratricopeptide (TPR) repeat protein
MNKYKICIYAICKNEEKFIDRWVDSMREADKIFVLDTGSTDGSVNILKKRGVNIKVKTYNPWRFDDARNDSLDMVDEDTDICVCTDIDEVFNKDWRKKLEKIWTHDTSRVYYKLNTHIDKNNIPGTSLYISKIHKRNMYKWKYPIHEVLTSINKDKEVTITTDEIIINHYPDEAKSRANYLSLLKLAVKENPIDDRCMHYLGREYMYHKKWNKAIDTLIKYLSLESATWKYERSASMRYIGKCYKNLKRMEEAKLWLTKSITESSDMRDGLGALGEIYYEEEKYLEAKKILELCLNIKERTINYMSESIWWNGYIEDILSICEYKLNNKVESLKYVKEALKYNPDNERIKNNLKIIEDMK